MSEPVDPPRLADGAGGDFLRAALDGARADVPTSGAVEAMWARFPFGGPGGGGPSGGPKPGPGPSAPPAPLGPAAHAASAGALKTLGAALVIGGLALGAYKGAPWLGLRSGPVPVVSATAPSSTVALPDPRSPPSASAAAAVASVTPAESASASPLRSAHAPSSASASPLMTEVELLTEAHRQVGSNPARALELARQHRSQFPKGQLGQERDMIEIQALNALGRTDEARARADDFRKRHPQSPFGPRLDEMFPPR